MPLYGAIMLIIALSSMGLPGLNGFVGEFTILLGIWASNPWWAASRRSASFWPRSTS